MYVKMGRVTPSKKVTRKDYSSFDDNDKEYSAVQFTYQESTHSKYKKIFIEKDNADKKLNISFRQSLNENLSLIMWFIYGPNSKIVKEESVIYDYKNNDYPFYDKNSQVKSYLKKYHITIEEVEDSYDQVIKDLILKDWTKVYDSQFTPSDYDKIEVKKQWEDW